MMPQEAIHYPIAMLGVSLSAYENSNQTMTGILESSVADTPLTLSTLWISDVVRAFPALASSRKSKQAKLFGLKLRLCHPPSLAHSGWIAYAVTCKLGELARKYEAVETWVSIRVAGEYTALEQFSLLAVLGPTALFCAMGDHAEQCLRTIVEAEHSFEPTMFDADGYYIGPSIDSPVFVH
jgi:hypothetical protein